MTKPYTELTKSEVAELRCQRDIHTAVTRLEFIHAFRTIIDEIGIIPSGYSNYIDFDNCTRPQLLTIIKRFPGKWLKEPGYDGGVHYTLATPVLGDLQVRIYNGEPPSACVIEETVEYVEVPARTERRVTRTVKCPEPTVQ